MSVYVPPLRRGAKGDPIRGAQWLLSGHNRQKIKTYDGPLDGRYGPGTEKAVERMKHLLGYPAAQVDGRFGLQVYGYLVPWGHRRARVRPAAYVARGRARRDAAARPSHAYPIRGARFSIIGFPYQGTHRLGNWQSDRGYDLSCPWGSMIVAPRAGIIGPKWGSLGKGGTLAGQRLYVLCSSGQQYYLAHNGLLIARPGQRVRAGDPIARSNFPGTPHLHVTCRYGDPAVEILGGRIVRPVVGLVARPYIADAHPTIGAVPFARGETPLVLDEDLEDEEVGGPDDPFLDDPLAAVELLAA